MSEFIKVKATKRSISKRKAVFGIGINDADYLTSLNNGESIIRCEFYKRWHNMLKRCYYKQFYIKYQAYKGCSVIKEWHLFSNFKKWMKKQDWKDKHLDKDIFEIGNKVYGPDSCVFIDQEVNKLLCNCESSRGKYPQGVYFRKDINKFSAQISLNGKINRLGVFKYPEEASRIYNKFKAKEIKRVADLQSDQRVRDGLYRHAELYVNTES